MLNWATSGDKNLVGYILEAIQGMELKDLVGE